MHTALLPLLTLAVAAPQADVESSPKWSETGGLSAHAESIAILFTGVGLEYRQGWFALRGNVYHPIAALAALVSTTPSVLLFNGNHHAEVAVALSHGVGLDTGLIVAPSVGYRYQRPEGGLVFRVGSYVPRVSGDDGTVWFPFPYLGVGYGF